MRIAYTLLLFVALPFIFLRLWLRGKKLPQYRKRWRERLGIFEAPKFNNARIWIHCVSVGEFIAAQALIKHFQQQKKYDLVVTTMTPTGSERVQEFSRSIFHVYIPYDHPFLVSTFLKKIKPSIAIFMETELWPNTLKACKENNVPVVIANARLSERSARGYRKFSGLTRQMLQAVSVAAIQNRDDAERFLKLGLPENSCRVTGSIKFDFDIDKELVASAKADKELLRARGKSFIFIAASTHKGEEDIILKAFRGLRERDKNILLILVPRHPDRFDEVYTLCERHGFTTARRSTERLPSSGDAILLGDTMGELLALYGLADVAFIGGSFAKIGGHNFIEAAAWGLPLLSGPHTFNFSEISNLLMDNDALIKVATGTDLEEKVALLIDNENMRDTLREGALKVCRENKGALQRLIDIIEGTLNGESTLP